MHVVTLATPAQLPDARVLARSLQRHAAFSLEVVLLDVAQAEITLEDPAFLPARSVPYPEPGLDAFVAALTGDALTSVALPAALLHALDRAGDVVIYLAPTVEVFAPLDALAATARARGIAALPRLPMTISADRHPDDVTLTDLGAFRTSVLAFSPRARPAIERWLEVATRAWNRSPYPSPAEQFAAIAARYDAGVPDDHRAHLDTLGVECDLDLREDKPFIDGNEVVTFDFAGHDPARPHRLHAASPAPNRVRLSGAAGLRTLLTRHVEEVVASSDGRRNDAIESVELVAGIPFDDVMRRLHRNRLAHTVETDKARPESPWRNGDDFLAWCSGSEHPGPVPVSRYLEEVRRGRPDLLDAFPQVPGIDTTRFLEWARTHGRVEANIPEQMLTPAKEPVPPRYLQAGVNLAGFLTADLGVGEAARRVGDALDAGHIPHSTFAFTRTANRVAASAGDVRVDHSDLGRFDTNIVCVNADSLGSFAQTVGPEFFADRHTIGVWFWETSDFPRIFHPAFRNVDEIWTASDYIAGALRSAAPDDVPIVRFPLPIVRPPVDPTATRATLGLPVDRFVFLFSFDYQSIAERKNPFALVDAFRAAFAPGEGPLLLIKSINAERWPDDLERLRYAARGRDDIELRDGYVDAATNMALIAHSDCVVSLHRSEGFGFNLADAIALGVPVIASGYSGNLAFMRADDCYLVPCTETEVGEGHFPYDPKSRWGDPDLAEAARLMRHVAEHRDEARDRAQRAQARVLAEFAPAVCGEFIRNRLAAVRAGAAATSADPGDRHRLDDRLRTVIAKLRQARG
jgi:glycosyltransferase involved in cell wall biosynthesis